MNSSDATQLSQSAPATGSAALSARDNEVLDELKHWKYNKGWARPMDVGGRDCSHHSRTLSKLVRLGYAEARRRCVSIQGALGSDRAGKEYKAVKPPNNGLDG